MRASAAVPSTFWLLGLLLMLMLGAQEAEAGWKPRVVIVPGITLCNVEKRAFYADLRNRLQAAGLNVTLKKMPNCMGARESIWIPFMRNNLSCDNNTVIVGHSSGAIAGMRFAQNYPIAGLVIVSAYYTDLGMGMEKRSEYFRTPWDWDSMKANAPWIMQAGSTNDPWLGGKRFYQQQYVSNMTNSEFHVFHYGHFLKPQFPELADLIIKKFDEKYGT